MCQVSEKTLTKPGSKKAIKGYRVYQVNSPRFTLGLNSGRDFPITAVINKEKDLKDWKNTSRSFYQSNFLPEMNTWVNRSSGSFHAFADFKNLKLWIDFQMTYWGQKGYTWRETFFLLIVQVELRDNVVSGTWEATDIKTITGNEIFIKTKNAHVCKISDGKLIRIPDLEKY